MKKFLFVLLTSFFVSTLNYGYAEESKTSNTTLNEKNTQSIDSINGEIKKLQAKYEITKSAKDKKNISAKISTLKKQLDKLNKDRVTGSVSSGGPCPGHGCISEGGITSSKKKPTPTPTPTHRTELWDIFIGAAIKDEIDGLQAKYNQTKDAKEKESISNKITELEKELEGLIKKEIEGLKAKYNQTKDAKEKDSITKRIDEHTRKLESLSNAPTPSKPKTEQAPTTGARVTDVDAEETLIKKEIEGLKAKYNQTKDAKEKDSITKRIDELTRKLESLSNAPTPSKPKTEQAPTPSKPKTEQAPTTGARVTDVDAEETLIKKEIEGLKAKYNQTKDAKEKDSITKRIDELTRKLESLSNAPTPSKPKNEQAPTTGSKQSDNNTEVNAIKNEIESLKAKYDQTKDAREKDSITKRIDELTRKLQSLVN